jgi:hypothetical protein
MKRLFSTEVAVLCRAGWPTLMSARYRTSTVMRSSLARGKITMVPEVGDLFLSGVKFVKIYCSSPAHEAGCADVSIRDERTGKVRTAGILNSPALFSAGF